MTSPVLAAPIRPANKSGHVGQIVTVKVTISEVHTAWRSHVIFVHMGGRYPDYAFTEMVFSENADAVPKVPR